MTAKKILFTVTNDLSYDQRMIRICGSLARAGYGVVLIGRKRKSSIPLKPENFQQHRLSCFFDKGKLFYIEYNLRLFFCLLFSSFDAVCAIDLDTILPSFLISKLKRKKMIYDAHEYFTETPEVVRRPLVKKVWETIAAFCIPRISFAYTVGEGLQQIFSERYGIPFGLIRNVPTTKPQATSAKISPPVILYQGVLNEGRGISEMMQAMQWIEDAQLWLVGEGDLSEKLRAECQNLGLTEKVHFKGYLVPAELGELTSRATIGLNLLENRGLNYYYSLANKAFDYVQALVPAVHMDFPEYRQLNSQQEVAILISDLDAKTIGIAIQSLLSDKNKYEQLVGNCREARKKWCWEEEEKTLVAFYENVFTRIKPTIQKKGT